MILIRVVRCMMPGWGVGGLGSVTLRKESGIRNPEIRRPLPQSPPHHPVILSPSPRPLLSLPLRPDWRHTRGRLCRAPLSVHWAWGALEIHVTLTDKVRLHLKSRSKD